MTTKDTTRFLHQPVKHYAAAHLQQGRPLLDSDFNEGIRLTADDRRRALVDVIGGFGSPDEGFSLGGPLDFGDPERSVPSPLTFPIKNLSTTVVTLGGASHTIPDISIRPGSAFLGGMRFELEKPEHFAFQRDFLQMQGADVVPSELGELYYLHAWEQCVTAVEDRELVEQALGGPDTMVRIRRMRRVEKFGLSSPHLTNCKEAFYTFVDVLENDNAIFDWTSGELRSRGRLQLQFQGGSDGNPCTPDPVPQYLGTENQTLRILLTHPDRFVWAIDNGAPLYRVTVKGLDSSFDEVRVTMLTPPRDEAHRPRELQVVELLPFAALVDRDAPVAPGDPHFNKIASEIGVFTRMIGSFDARNNSFVIDRSFIARSGKGAVDEARDTVHTWDEHHPARAHLDDESEVRHFYMRLWHDAPQTSDVELSTTGDFGGPGQPLGKTGIRPFFVQAGRRGDYWTATLRVDQRGRIVPFNLLTDPEGEPPSGPRHFYMPVGYLRLRPPGFSDCRPRTRPLRDTGCETRTVGDGLKSIGDYPTIGQAIESLPIGGGRIVVRPGVYREEILLPSNVILDGCGDDTLLVSPATPAQAALVRVAPGAENVKVRSFRIHAVEQVAIQMSSAERVELASLDVFAFTAAGTPGSGASNEPLIDVVSTNASSFRALRLAPSRRPALSVVSSNDIRVEGVSASTDRETAEAPAEPLVLFNAVEGLRVGDVSLEAFGQVALHIVSSSNVTLARLEMLGGAHTDDAPTRTVLDVESCTDLVFEDSHVVQEASPSEHAAVAVVGNDLTLRRNRIRALPLCFEDPAPEDPEACEDILHVAWGGIQVRSGSGRVEISKNHIQGGLGHGVTLGSVLWGTDQSSASHREGAGKVLSLIDPEAEPPQAYVHGDLSAGFELNSEQVFAFDEAVSQPISDVLIAENRIEGMATNGISVLSVLGLAESASTDLFEVRGLRIERNVITGNLRQLPSTTTTRNDVTPLSTAGRTIPQDIPVLPYAGITLAAVTGGPTIANNQIVGNGTTDTMPVCGIFVLNGDAIVIARNRIIDNGALASTSAPLERGLRAGIAVMLSGSDRAQNTDNLAAILLVQSNPLVEARTMNNADLAGEFALRILDNVVRQPEGRALHVISTGMISVDGNFLLSQGYHGALAPVDQLAIGDVVFVQGLGGAWETLNALDFPTTGIDFVGLLAPNASHGWLSNAIGASPRLYVGSGGGVLFHNNQVVYDWTVRVLPSSVDSPLSFFPVVIIGQDHVGVIGNQFALRLQGADEAQVGSGAPSLIPEIFLGNALIGGLTTQVARNRFAEPIESARISLVTAAEMLNVTSLNTGTHPTLAYRWRHPVSYTPPGTTPSTPDLPQSFFAQKNPALFTRAGVNFQDLHNDLTSVIRTFFQLLNQRT